MGFIEAGLVAAGARVVGGATMAQLKEEGAAWTSSWTT